MIICRYKKLLLIFAFLVTPALAQADWVGQALRVECVPAIGHFKIYHTSYRGVNAADALEKGLDKALQQQGIYVSETKGSCSLGKDEISWEIGKPNLFSVTLFLNRQKLIDSIPLSWEYRGNITGFAYTSDYKPGISEFSLLGEWQSDKKHYDMPMPKVITKTWLYENFKECNPDSRCDDSQRWKLKKDD